MSQRDWRDYSAFGLGFIGVAIWAIALLWSFDHDSDHAGISNHAAYEESGAERAIVSSSAQEQEACAAYDESAKADSQRAVKGDLCAQYRMATATERLLRV